MDEFWRGVSITLALGLVLALVASWLTDVRDRRKKKNEIAQRIVKELDAEAKTFANPVSNRDLDLLGTYLGWRERRSFNAARHEYDEARKNRTDRDSLNQASFADPARVKRAVVALKTIVSRFQ